MLPLLLACGSGSVAITDSAAPADTEEPLDTLPDDTQDTTDTQTDTGAADEESFEAGSFVGEIQMEVPTWNWTVCTGAVSLTIDADGRLEGTSMCLNEEKLSYPVYFSGALDEDGLIAGEIVMVDVGSDDKGTEYSDPLGGLVAEDKLTLLWQTHITDDPDGKGGIVVEGYGSAERE